MQYFSGYHSSQLLTILFLYHLRMLIVFMDCLCRVQNTCITRIPFATIVGEKFRAVSTLEIQ